MKISDYPRPPGDNGRGIHWSPKQQNHGIHNWELWDYYLRYMRISWVKVVAAPDEDSVQVFRRLATMRIMSVVRYIAHMPSGIDASMLDHARQLRDECGVPYVERVNEPDADVEWPGGRPADWHLQTAAININDARKIQAQGQIPLIAMYNAPPGPNCIQLMLQVPGGRDVLSGPCALSIHNYGKGRPLEYPNDHVHMFGTPLSQAGYLQDGMPPDFWTESQIRESIWNGSTLDQVNAKRQATKNPNDNIMSNITNFRMFEYWTALWDAEGLPECPIIGTEAGWEVDDLEGVDHGKFPQPTADLHAAYHEQQALFQDGTQPLTLLNPDGSTYELTCPDRYFFSGNWLIAERMMGEGGQWEQGAWVTHWHDPKYGLDGKLPATEMLHVTPDRIRANGPWPPVWKEKWTPWNADWYGCDYDSRIDYIQPRIGIYPPEAHGWYPKSFEVQYPSDKGTPFAGSYIFMKAYRNGQQVDDVQFMVDETPIPAKPAPDWADYRMQAPRPRHSVRVAGDTSTIITNLGLGIENKPSWDGCTFIIRFEYREGRADMSWMTERIQMGTTAHLQGQPVPDEVQPYWDRAKAVDENFSEPKATIRRPGLQAGQKYHKVIYIGILPGDVNSDQHHAFLEYVDGSGAPIRNPNKSLRWGWAGMSQSEFDATSAIPIEKPAGVEFGGNQPLGAGQQGVFPIDPSKHTNPWGDGLPSEWVDGVHTAYPDLEPGNTRFHTSHYIVYTEATWGGDLPPPVETYTIEVIANPAQGGAATGGGDYQQEDMVELVAVVTPGWAFRAWYENGASISTASVLRFQAEADRIIEARFEEGIEPPPDTPLVQASGQTVVMFDKDELQAAINNASGDTVTVSFNI